MVLGQATVGPGLFTVQTPPPVRPRIANAAVTWPMPRRLHSPQSTSCSYRRGQRHRCSRLRSRGVGFTGPGRLSRLLCGATRLVYREDIYLLSRTSGIGIALSPFPVLGACRNFTENIGEYHERIMISKYYDGTPNHMLLMSEYMKLYPYTV